jgi:hypothetical protein
MNITYIIVFPLKILVIVMEAITKGIGYDGHGPPQNYEYLENFENPMLGDDYIEMMY